MGDFIEQLAQREGKSFEELEAEFFRTARLTSLIKRFASPEEVASLVTYVAAARCHQPPRERRFESMGEW